MKRFGVVIVLVFAMVFTVGCAFAGTLDMPDKSDIPVVGLVLFAALGMALSANAYRDQILGDVNEFGVLLSTHIYQGAAIGLSVGYARGLVAGDKFVGFAMAEADNSSGSSGDINVRVLRRGVIQVAITSFAITDVNKPVYASADGTFTLTPTSNSFVGTAIRFVSTGYCEVAFDAMIFPTGFNNSILASGIHTSVQTADDVTIAGVVATDVVVATMHTVGSSPVTLKSVITATGKITITFSGAPSTDHKVNYVVIRPSA